MPHISEKSKLRNKVTVDFNQLYSAAMKIRAVNHPLRKTMIELLDKNKEMMVTDIYVRLRLEQSVASQHLAILRNQGIVKTRRDGKQINYSVNYDELKRTLEVINDL